jgi:hypothetical protein
MLFTAETQRTLSLKGWGAFLRVLSDLSSPKGTAVQVFQIRDLLKLIRRSPVGDEATFGDRKSHQSLPSIIFVF